MKSTNILICLLILFCLAVPRGISNAAVPQGDSAQILPAPEEFGHFFNVSVAKEPIYFILVEKNLQRLRVIEFDDGLRTVADYPCATGENFGIKELSGDAKTPEGVYFITQIFRDDKITIFGDKAFHLDYPNFFDQRSGRNGDGIYIHGTNKKLEPNSTNGCVTLANNDLDDLGKYLNQVVTPVIIVPEFTADSGAEIRLLTENDFTLAKSLLLDEQIKPENVEYNFLYVVQAGGQTVAVTDFIYRPFNRSIMRGASRIYLDYSAADGWSARQRIWRVSPLQIYPEAPFKIAASPLASGEVQLAEQTPEEAAAMVAALTPRQKEEKNLTSGEALPSGQQVAAIDTGPKEATQPAGTAPQVATPPAVKISATPSPQGSMEKKVEQQQKIVASSPVIPRDDQQILDFVESWRQAWESRQIEPYIAFYDESFRSDDKNLAAWKAHKEKLNQTYQEIRVNISDIKVQWTKAGVSVSFLQEYRSDLYRARGNKTLHLVESGPGWKIKREIYSRI